MRRPYDRDALHSERGRKRPLYLFVTRTHVLRLVLGGCLLWPSPAHAQAKEAFVEGLTQLINAIGGTFGDEGPALTAAIEAMTRGLAEWDARVARVESGFRVDVAAAAPPAAARMHATLGTVYLERGRFDDALAQFASAAELDPSLAQVHLLRGLAYERSERSREAAAAYRAAWQARPADPTTAYLVLRSEPTVTAALDALWNAVTRRAESANTTPGGFPIADLLDDASVAVPLFPPVAYGRGFTLLRHGKYEEALSALRNAVAVDPLVTDRALHSDEVKRGLAALREKNVRVAVAELEAASTRNPQSADVHRILGMVLAIAKQYEQGLVHLREAARLNARDERSRIAIADVLMASGRPDAARDSLRDTIRDLPDSAEAHWQLGRVEQALGDAAAVQSFENAATKPIVAGRARLYAIVGQAQHAQFDVDAAAEAYRRRVWIAPNDRDAHFDLGEVRRAQDKLDEARVEYLAAAWLDPASARTFAMLGQVEAAAGRDEVAVVVLRRALTLDAGLLEARYALSRALLRLGRTEEAQQELRAYEQAQAKAMDEQRRQFRDNQQKIDDVLKAK
jgi:tetratricopeptide (TPR) repeat protein